MPLAITGALATTVAGRLYDKFGPRPLVAFGFSVRIINMWQLSQLQANTPIEWVVFLLALRGLALGSTVQTTFVTALSVVPLKQIARGAALTNATRQVVQSIGVAILATVLASTLSPQISALQQQFQDTSRTSSAPPVTLCVTPFTAMATAASSSAGASESLQINATPLLVEAYKENVAGFERAYTITFYAALVALALGLMLPRWPFKWAGRRAADTPPPVGH